jgi:hypothetical protein
MALLLVLAEGTVVEEVLAVVEVIEEDMEVEGTVVTATAEAEAEATTPISNRCHLEEVVDTEIETTAAETVIVAVIVIEAVIATVIATATIPDRSGRMTVEVEEVGMMIRGRGGGIESESVRDDGKR